MQGTTLSRGRLDAIADEDEEEEDSEKSSREGGGGGKESPRKEVEAESQQKKGDENAEHDLSLASSSLPPLPKQSSLVFLEDEVGLETKKRKKKKKKKRRDKEATTKEANSQDLPKDEKGNLPEKQKKSGGDQD